jgi:hypothetical protein
VSVSRPRRLPSRVVSSLALLAAGLVLSACQEVPSNQVKSEPFKLEQIKGTDIQRVRLSAEIARKIDLQTAEVRAMGDERVVPHAALIYNPEGKAFVYTVPEPLAYVRAPVDVSRATADLAVLAEGPPAGTVVVTVGAAELLATEYEILNQHP